MTTLIYDLVIVAVLALFAWRGWHKGLLLSLCGLVVIILSLVGSGFIADTLATPVADAIEPKLAATIEENLNAHIAAHYDDLEPSSPLDALRDMGGAYAWAADAVEDTMAAGTGALGQAAGDAVASIAKEAAHFAAVQIAHHIIFAVAFVVLFIVLTLILHALDLVAKLPGLHFCNGLGGGLIGLVKGVLVLFVAVCVLQVTSGHLFTPEVVEDSRLLRFFVDCNPILTLFRPDALT